MPQTPPVPIFVSIQGAADLKALTARLKAAKRVDLQKKLRTKLKEAGDPTVRDIRAAAMQIKVTRGLDATSQEWSHTENRMVLKKLPPRKQRKGGPRTTMLRARLARATTVSVTRKGIRIKVSAKKFGDYGVTLPRYADAEFTRWKRWRSPIFWPGPISEAPPTRVKQQHGSPWFMETIREHRKDFRRAVFDAMDEVGKELVG